MSFSCFGKRALGFEIPIEWSIGKLTLTEYLEVKDDRTTTSTVGIGGSDKKETSSNLRRTKK